MLKILVAGGFDDANKETRPGLQAFAQLLGREVLTQGHLLLNACRTPFDCAVAEGAQAVAGTTGQSQTDRIISYVMAGRTPAHTFGNVRTSQLVDWELGNPRLRVPEPIESADAVIVVDRLHPFAAPRTIRLDEPLP